MISGERPEADKDKKYTVWMVVTILLTVMVLACIVAITVYIDPFFHYHKPLEGYAYPLNNVQVPGSGDRTFGLREQNDGIVRHFDYDSIICGTSMTENFKASQADAIFDADFVKVPLSGASYRESHDIFSGLTVPGKTCVMLSEALTIVCCLIIMTATMISSICMITTPSTISSMC